jgi:hypothetical protein
VRWKVAKDHKASGDFHTAMIAKSLDLTFAGRGSSDPCGPGRKDGLQAEQKDETNECEEQLFGDLRWL